MAEIELPRSVTGVPPEAIAGLATEFILEDLVNGRVGFLVAFTFTGTAWTRWRMASPGPPEPGRLPRVERRRRVLAFLADCGASTTAELVAGLGWTRSTVRAVLAELVVDGEVRPLAAGLQAPGQRYASA